MTPRAAAVERTRQKRLTRVREHRNSKGCQRCPERDPLCLDLHHLDPSQKHPKLTRKRGGRGSGRNGWSEMSFTDIEAELEKCIVLCANCHRKTTPG